MYVKYVCNVKCVNVNFLVNHTKLSTFIFVREFKKESFKRIRQVVQFQIKYSVNKSSNYSADISSIDLVSWYVSDL